MCDIQFQKLREGRCGSPRNELLKGRASIIPGTIVVNDYFYPGLLSASMPPYVRE